MTPTPLVLLLAATPAHVIQDQAGNRLEPFLAVSQPSAAGAALHCTADRRWCAEIRRDNDQAAAELRLFAGAPNGEPPVASRALGEDGDDAPVLWPSIVRLAGADAGVMIGVERRVSTMYSGGGGSAGALELLRVSGGQVTPMLSAPIAGSLMIRACFSERDVWLRREACHDEYRFDASLSLDPTTAAGPPRLTFEARATTFPAGVSRSSDSGARGRLRAADLVETVDPTCSYRRLFAFDPAAGAYAPDKVLPDCSDYTVP